MDYTLGFVLVDFLLNSLSWWVWVKYFVNGHKLCRSSLGSYNGASFVAFDERNIKIQMQLKNVREIPFDSSFALPVMYHDIMSTVNECDINKIIPLLDGYGWLHSMVVSLIYAHSCMCPSLQSYFHVHAYKFLAHSLDLKICCSCLS